MKPSNYRRMRRRPASREAASFKKDNQQEQSFFGETMHEPFFRPVAAIPQPAAIQRKCDGCEKEEKNQQALPEKKEEEKTIQKKSDGMEKKEEDKKPGLKSLPMGKKEEDKKLQKKDAGGAAPAGGNVGNYVGSLSGKGQPMTAQSNSFFSSRIGYDFSNVKIHTGKEAGDSAKAIHARAYTIGNNIVFANGAYQPDTPAGKLLLAHELVHVMQQDNSSLHRKTDDVEPAAEPEPGLQQLLPPVRIDVEGSKIQNTRHYGDCAGVSVSGDTQANYTSSGALQGRPTRATDCSGCDNCITINSTVVSTFRTAPVVTLPPVPGDLNPCERRAVRAFINGTLNQHEQQHVAAFNTYRGRVTTPFSFTGCESDLAAAVQDVHDNIETPRREASDALSAALDANGANVFTVTCECPDPAPPATTE